MYFTKTCTRTIEISDDASMNDLRDAIQDAVGFDRDHLYEFFLANNTSPWAKQCPITEEEEWEDKERDFENTKLKTICPLGRKKLYYHFDFGDDWIFEIRPLRGLKMPEQGVSYPRVVKRGLLQTEWVDSSLVGF